MIFSGVHLRLHNDSGQGFTGVELIVGDDVAQIGSLPPNEFSDYVTFAAMPYPPSIRAQADQTMYEWTAEAAAGEGLIAGGQFTLELTLENNELAVGFLMKNPILHDRLHSAYSRSPGQPPANPHRESWRLDWQYKERG